MRVSRQVVVYFALAFAIAWIGVMSTEGRIPNFIAMLAGPTVACLVLTATLEKARGIRELAQRLRSLPARRAWYAVVFVAPAILLVIMLTLSVVSPGFTPAIFAGGSTGDIVMLAVVGGVLSGMFEEVGWTGYATPRLLRRYSWFATGLIIGVPWAIWHMLPDYFGHASWPMGLWVAHAIQWLVALAAFRIFMTWVYSRARSVPLAMLLHASFTGTQLLLVTTSDAASIDLIWYGLFGIELWFLVAFVIVFGDAFASVAASKEERVRPLLGDVLVPHPAMSITHAISIDRPPAEVWPWLQQMGSSDARVDTPALPGPGDTFVVTAVEPGRDLLLTVAGRDRTVATWEHYLEPENGGTRLIVRERASRDWKTVGALAHLPDAVMLPLASLGHRWMEARHLRGIKRRAEARG